MNENEIKILQTKANRLDEVLKQIRRQLSIYAEEPETYFEKAFVFEGLLKTIHGEIEK